MHTELSRNFTKQRLQFICYEFNGKVKNEWNKSWMKLTAGVLWFILKMKFFGRINNAKGKHPTPGQFYLFSFLAGKRQSWLMHQNVGLNPYSFNVLFNNNFSKLVIFGNVYNTDILYLHPCCDGVKPAS